MKCMGPTIVSLKHLLSGAYIHMYGKHALEECFALFKLRNKHVPTAPPTSHKSGECLLPRPKRPDEKLACARALTDSLHHSPFIYPAEYGDCGRSALLSLVPNSHFKRCPLTSVSSVCPWEWTLVLMLKSLSEAAFYSEKEISRW